MSRWRPSTRSPRMSAVSGIRKAVRLLANCAPPKRAMAAMGVKFHGCGSNRTAAAARTIPARMRYRLFFMVFCLLLSVVLCFPAVLVRGQQICEIELAPLHDRAGLAGNGPAENRAGVDERVEFAILAAGIDVRGQAGQQGGVEGTTGKRSVQLLRVHTNERGAEAVADEFPRQLGRVES